MMQNVRRGRLYARLRKVVLGGVGVGIGLMPLIPSTAFATAYYEMDFPRDLSISIELGADCVSTPTVGVHTLGSNAAWVLFSNDALFRDGEWQAFSGEETFTWPLSEGDGEKTVYALFKSKSSNRSTPVYDTVKLDVADNCGMPREDVAAEGMPSGVDADEQERAPLLGSMRGQSFATVYRVEDGLRRPYMNPTIFATWETGFDQVTWVPDAKLPDYAMGAPMLPKAGVVMVKMTDADKVYWVHEGEDGSYVLRWVVSPEVAAANFGQNWANSVVDVDATLFARYKMGNAITMLEKIDAPQLKTRQELARRVH